MFNELLNLNIEACSGSKLNALIRQTSFVVDFRSKLIEELLRRSENNALSNVPEEISNLQIIVIANGRKHTVQQLSDINEEDFDVILDTRTNSLRFRKDPAKHTKLKESKQEKIGSHRMQILAYMLEHSGKPLHAGNIINNLIAGSGEIARNTFSKSIGVIRKSFDQKDTSGPYIVKRPDYEGITGLKRGYVYEVNPKWKYLIIRYRNNSG